MVTISVFSRLLKVFLKKWRIVIARPLTISGTYACSAKVRLGRETSLAMDELLPEQNAEAGEQDVGQRERKQELPAELHDLVVAEARQRPADHELQPDEDHELDDEGEHLQADDGC